MLSYFAKKKSKRFSAQHHDIFCEIYNSFKSGDFKGVLSIGEGWLIRFPNVSFQNENIYYKYSNNPKDLSPKGFVFFSNTIFYCMSISAFNLGDMERSLRYRFCMYGSVDFTRYCHLDTKLSWRLVNLSIQKDLHHNPELKGGRSIRNIDEKDLASVLCDGPLIYDQPRIEIDLVKGEIIATFSGHIETFDFRMDGTIGSNFERIASWIQSSGRDADWIHNRAISDEWLDILEESCPN